MAVSQARLNAYRSDVDAAAEAAGIFVNDYIGTLMALYPDMSVADICDEAIEAIKDALNAFGDQAAATALELLEEIVASYGISVTTSIVDAIDDEMIDGGVRYAARKLVAGDVAAFTADVADLSRFYIKRSAFENMVANCESNNLRYARVPSGFETCEFCIMLASRGFVYHTAKTAGAGHAYHRGCDCVVTPGVDGIPASEQIEGYDPDALYKQWKAMRDGKATSSSGSFPLIKGAHSIEDDLRATNPRYSEGVEWQKNCQRCVPTYEMRRRGYDVTAKLIEIDPATGKPSKSDSLHGKWKNIFKDADWIPCNGTGKAKIDRLMKEWGDGARAEVYVAWKGGGAHVFIAENVDGVVKYRCPQTNNSDYSSAFSRVRKGLTQVARIDNLEPSELIQDCCEGVS